MSNGLIIATSGIVISLVFSISFTQAAIFPYGSTTIDFKLVVFLFMIIVFSIAQFFFMKTVRVLTKTARENALEKFHLKMMHPSIQVAQYAFIFILSLTFFQIYATSSYSLFLLIAVVWISHFTSTVLLIQLGIHLLGWFRNNHNLAVVLFAAAIIMISINLVFVLLYYTNETRDDPVSIASFRGQVTNFNAPDSLFQTAYFVSYVLAFLFSWSATVVLLYNYSNKIGKVKFWFALSVPLIYFTLQFEPMLLNLIVPLRFSNPVLFGVAYTLIFSGIKPIGGILVGIAFWLVAKNVNQKSVRRYLVLTACGIILLFSSNEGTKLLAPTYPPIGLVVVCFMPLASYYLVVGIYFSVISIAQDTKLRKYVLQSTKSLEKQLGFLGSIGSSAMEQEIQSKVENLGKKFAAEMEEDSGIPTSLDASDIKDYVNMVIKERELKK